MATLKETVRCMSYFLNCSWKRSLWPWSVSAGRPENTQNTSEPYSWSTNIWVHERMMGCDNKSTGFFRKREKPFRTYWALKLFMICRVWKMILSLRRFYCSGRELQTEQPLSTWWRHEVQSTLMDERKNVIFNHSMKFIIIRDDAHVPLVSKLIKKLHSKISVNLFPISINSFQLLFLVHSVILKQRFQLLR